MIRVVYSPRFRRELQNIIETIANDDVAAAYGFVERLEHYCSLTCHHARNGNLYGLRSVGMFVTSAPKTILSSIDGTLSKSASMFCRYGIADAGCRGCTADDDTQ